MKNRNKHKEEDSSLIMGTENLDENFIKSVGLLTLNFAHLEFCFTLFAGSQFGIKYPLNRIILSELSYKQLLNISAGIYKELETDIEKLEKFNQILKDSFVLEQQRNTITHSFYGHDENAKIIVRRKNSSKGKKGYREQEEIINAETVNEIAEQMKEISTELVKMIFSMTSE
jgi:hypothetical protein